MRLTLDSKIIVHRSILNTLIAYEASNLKKIKELQGLEEEITGSISVDPSRG